MALGDEIAYSLGVELWPVGDALCLTPVCDPLQIALVIVDGVDGETAFESQVIQEAARPDAKRSPLFARVVRSQVQKRPPAFC